MMIFVAGVYGVGKTTICELLSRELDYTVASASALIRQRRGQTTWNKNKKTHEIAQNQQHLIEALSELKALNRSVILDGHFALLDGDGKVVKIEKNVFFDLNIDVIVLIEGDAKEIVSRLSSRDTTQWSYSTIATLMAAERKGALEFHEESGVPLKIFDSSAQRDILNYLADLKNDKK
ncbi:ATP-binding protein [Pseudomonas sp. MS-1(2024)]|uniref:ATP-binding protein n=1 Tax=Pseudomonas sp. MS-1(2024) TaxID=3112251 RepID=UPI002DC00974|nr:ATP-binding protein [Pseudomonas sp. MS-1(2024)]MEC4170201.1 ATP-binding protein [Pseudomonas sp. MS-1(2024)]